MMRPGQFSLSISSAISVLSYMFHAPLGCTVLRVKSMRVLYKGAPIYSTRIELGIDGVMDVWLTEMRCRIGNGKVRRITWFSTTRFVCTYLETNPSRLVNKSVEISYNMQNYQTCRTLQQTQIEVLSIAPSWGLMDQTTQVTITTISDNGSADQSLKCKFGESSLSSMAHKTKEGEYECVAPGQREQRASLYLSTDGG
eukprot:166096-Hanusia_phi.AAC.1